jgi:MFS family permease
MLEKSFDLDEHMSAIINVIILSGNFVGCIFSMWVSNKFPRKYLITLGVLLIMIFSFFSIIVRNIYIFTILRHFANIGIGLMLAGSSALVTESININYRGFILNLILVSGSIGEIYITMSLGWFIDLENIHEWSKLFILAAAPVNLFNFIRY